MIQQLPHAKALSLALASSALCLFAASAPGQAQTPTSLQTLRQGFASPPSEARLRCYWWWLNGNTDKPTITHDLEEMKAKGFGGALLVDANGANQNGNAPVPAGPTFASPAWLDLYTHALKEADRLGLEITLNITSGWNLGGPDVTPEQASKILTWTRTQAQTHAGNTIHLSPPESRNGFYRQIAVLAYPLHRGTSLAPQPDDNQGDRHTAQEQASPTSAQSARTLRFRSAAAETGFSMSDASAMLNPGDPTDFADTSSSEILNLTSQTQSDGTLTWQAPAGEWEILRIGYTDSNARVSTSSGAWQGLAIDYLSREAFDQYWNHTVEPLLTAAKPFHSLKYLATDSWELGGTNWTPKFREQFLALRGYDPVPWLPVLAGRIVENRDHSTRFLTDLRRTVADLIVTEHYDVFAAHAKEHGLGTQSESGGPHGAPIDALETFRHAAITQTEFWSENAHRARDNERFFTKQASSAAHIYGQHFIAQEGETSIGPQWSESLATDLKPSFDMAITEGMNRLVWHEFTSSPAATGLPGQEYFAGSHLNPKVTWWNAGTPFFTYLNRVQFLMQQGVSVADVLYFYGDNVPNFVRLKADDPAHVLPGYDYDVTNEDALLRTLRIDRGHLTGPSGATWRALALPKTRRLSLPALTRIEAYVHAGGTLIGLPPTSTTGTASPVDQAKFDGLIRQIWGAACTPDQPHPYGAGKVFCTTDSHAALATMKVPEDAQPAATPNPTAASDSPFDFIHRRISGTDLYFTRNGSAHPFESLVTFRTTSGIPQLWNPVTGERSLAPTYKTMPDGRIQLPLALPPHGSMVVIFAPKESLPTLNPTQTTSPLQQTSWQITFPTNPAAAVQTQNLTSWTDSTTADIRFFSGTATYRTTVQAPAVTPGKQVLLHFANVHEIARIKINGKEAGAIWAEPYSLRVDPFLHPGTNAVEIEVTNLWPNRIIGDLQPGATHLTTSTNIKTYTAKSPLLPSGLIGPAEWILR